MKISLSNVLDQNTPCGHPSAFTGSADDLYPCDSLLWIGDIEHPAFAAAWKACRQSCDAISIRQSLSAALVTPPRQSITHIIVAQTNRHERATWAIDGDDLATLRAHFTDAKMLVLRGPLVAPTVRLPASADSGRDAAPPAWVESVSTTQSAAFLRRWFGSVTEIDPDSSLLPVVVVASRFGFAESLIESLSLLFQVKGDQGPLIQWQRELTQRSAKGFATILWDDSVADPASADQWRLRCDVAPHSRHVWMTSMATPREQAIALSHGVYQVFEKPGRLECLIQTLRVA